VRVINVVTCEPDDTFGQGAFHARVFDLTERLGASVIGAAVYEMGAGEKLGPYHFHHGVEEWLYVASGTPILRDPDGERALEPGELVAFPAGPAGAHTAHGPGRVVMFSAGDRGWGEAFISVYPDSDKIAAAPGVIFRRADAIETWIGQANETAPAESSRAIKLTTASPDPLGARLGAQTWSATLYELAPGEATAAYHYEWCREEWALVVSGTPTLRHADGETTLRAGDLCCFPQGPTGAHQLRNGSQDPTRVIVFSTANDRPMSAFYPDDDTVLIHVSDSERLLFRHADRIEDYWDGEPGAG
jgi:uncharacterized cupin superfamily protein